MGINGKQAYEATWDSSRIASGTYLYAVHATKAGQSGRILKKLAVVR